MAAAIDSTGLTQEYTPQEILKEVRNFLHAANHKVQSQRQRESLAQSALILLRTLPTARHAVLEYLANMFDEAVNNYLLEIDIGRSVTDSSGAGMHSLLHDACGVLHTFIQTHSVAWAPIISTWSLELLGHISSKYSDRRSMPHTGSLNELLQLWLTCKPTKLLIEVATECFAQMVGGAPESCVDALLEASVKYSPHFDWVVAHIGSCFPRTIITRVLMCGLKDYCHHGNQGDMDSDAKIPKMGSVVNILGHLASKHGLDIRDALMQLFTDSISDKSESRCVTTIPFLLQLASMSPLLLHILATDMVKALTAPVLGQLYVQFQPWRKTYPQEFDSMMSLVIHLVMQSDTGADKALEFLLYNATANKGEIQWVWVRRLEDDKMIGSGAECLENIMEKEDIAHKEQCLLFARWFLNDNTPTGTDLPLLDIQNTCVVLMDQILKETQMMVFRHKDTGADVPFLGALSASLPTLTQQMLTSSGKRIRWLQKLICYIILYKGERFGAETLAYILAKAEAKEQLAQFIYIQQEIEVGLNRVLAASIQLAVDQLHHQKDVNQKLLLDNLFYLTQWESSSNILIRSSFKQCLKPQWESLSNLLLHTDLQVAIVTLKLLNYISVPSDLAAGAVLSACGSLTSLFFRVLEHKDQRAVNKMLVACKHCAKELSKKSYTQSILVRYFIEGAIASENKHLLGGKTDLGTATTGSRDSHTSLLAENQSHGLSLTMLRSHSSVFHAGVIGPGLRKEAQSNTISEEIIHRNCSYLLEMLWTCCQDTVSMTTNNSSTDHDENTEESSPKSYKLTVSADLCRMIGNLMVEIATPDVLYNNRFWPEEESLKMTVERDLHVWKIFDDNPVLWDVLLTLAGNTLIISRCSPVIKSLTATAIHHFESLREKLASDSPHQLRCVCNIIHCLGKSGLLPYPMNMLTELFPLISPFEAFQLLLTVWRYLKENPPTEDPSEVTRRVCDPRHIEIIRSICHKHIDRAGDIYERFFKPLVLETSGEK